MTSLDLHMSGTIQMTVFLTFVIQSGGGQEDVK